MKRSYSLLILLCLAVQSQAQISITAEDIVEQGEVIHFGDAFANPFRLFNIEDEQGDAQVWDYSWLNPVNESEEVHQTSLFTPYGLFFLGRGRTGVQVSEGFGFGDFSFENVYNYYQRNDRSYRAIGLGLTYQGIPAIAVHSDKDELYQFPLSYGDRDTSTFAYEAIILGLGTYGRTGERQNTVDGWGTLITPTDTFECLRLVSNLTTIDSIQFGEIQFAFPRQERTYQWLAKDGNLPVLEISGTVSPFFGRFIPTRIRYQVDPADTPTETRSLVKDVSHTMVFPNPATDYTTLQYELDATSEVQIHLFNQTGQRLQQIQLGTQTAGQYEYDLDLSPYQGQLYIVQLQQNGQAENILLTRLLK